MTRAEVVGENSGDLPISQPTLCEMILDECVERGWTLDDLALRMTGAAGDYEYGLNRLCLDLLLFLPDDRNMRLGERTAAALGAAFGSSAELWLNLDRMRREVPWP